jgi:hypothetical protein
MNNRKRLSKFFFVTFFVNLFFFCFVQSVHAQDIIGKTITGIKGITKTVDEINAYSKIYDQQNKGKIFPLRPELEIPDELPGIDDENRRFSKWPLDASNLGNTANRISGVSQTIHSNFMATDFSSAAGGWPPDNNGDVGSTQVFIAQNFRLKVYAKPSVIAAAVTTPNGTSTALLAAPALDVTQNAFFRTAFATVNTTDPHVRYDRLTNRWFVISMSTNETTNNYLLFAVSSGATITSSTSFTFFRIQLSSFPVGNADIGKFLDYPTLGIDANSLYLGSNIFANSGGGAYSHSSAYVVKKSDMIAGTLTITPFSAINMSTPQGVHNDDAAATEGYIIGNFNSSLLGFRRVTYPGGVTTLSASTITVAINTTAAPIGQPALGSSGNLDVSNIRLFAAMVMKNKITGTSTLWTAHTIQVNASGVGSTTGGRNGCRWYEFQNLTGTPTMLQSGTLFNDAAANPRGFWFPSIAMSGQGHAVLASSSASALDRINIVIAGRYRTSVPGDLEDSTYATATGSNYDPMSGGFVNRWGDYSQVCIDPDDNMTMWAFHQYCNTTNSYGVRAIQLKAPPPATPTALGIIVCGTGPSVGTRTTDVTLNGTSTSNSEFYDPGAGYTNRLAVTTTGLGASISNLVFVNPTQLTFKIVWPTTLAGTTQTLTITNPDLQAVTTTYTLPTGCVLVPLNLISFTGKGIDKRVQLDWTTENEVNSDYIVVEKSTDKFTFNEIARLNSIGLSGGNYQHFDNKPSDINYYRLKQVDVSGAFKYSNIITVKFNEKLGFTVYPNPASASLTLEYATVFKNGTINITDAAGKRVLYKKVVESNKTTLDVSSLPSGVYVVEISNEKAEKLQQKIIIEKK